MRAVFRANSYLQALLTVEATLAEVQEEKSSQREMLIKFVEGCLKLKGKGGRNRVSN